MCQKDNKRLREGDLRQQLASKGLYKYLCKILKPLSRKGYQTVEDHAQEVICKVLYNLEKFQGKSKFITWVVSVAKNYKKDELRKENNKEKAGETSSNGNEAYEPEQRKIIYEKERIALLSKEIEKESEEHQEIINRCLQKLSYKDIAKSVNLKEDTVRQTIHRFLKKSTAILNKLEKDQ